MQPGMLVRGRWLITRWGAEHGGLGDGALYIEGGVVQDVGEYASALRRHPGCTVVGDGTHLIIPGLANSHSHGRGISTLARGLADEPLELRLLALRSSRVGDPYWDALLSCVRQLESGITTTMHVDTYYAGPREEYEAKLRRVIAAYADSGIRFSIAVGIRDRNTCAYLDDAALLERLSEEAVEELLQRPRPAMQVAEYLDMYERLGDSFQGVAFQFGPTNPVWCSDETLAALRAEATRRGAKIHMHLLETPYQKTYALRTYGQTAVKRLADTGFLGPDVNCAHCVWVTEEDIGLLRDSGCVVVHNPSSNLRLRSGLAPVRAMVEAGVSVALGLDSLGLNDDEDMLQEVRLAQLLQSPPGIDLPAISSDTAMQWASENGARVTGICNIGRLEIGCPADLIMARIDWAQAAPAANVRDISARVAQWLRRSAVDVVMVGGKILVEQGRYVHRDRSEVERKACENRYPMAGPTCPGVMPETRQCIAALYRDWQIGGKPYYTLNAR